MLANRVCIVRVLIIEMEPCVCLELFCQFKFPISTDQENKCRYVKIITRCAMYHFQTCFKNKGQWFMLINTMPENEFNFWGSEDIEIN